MWRVALAAAAVLALITTAALMATSSRSSKNGASANRRALPIALLREKLGNGEGERTRGAAQEAYEDRALPNQNVTFERVRGAQRAFDRVESTSAPTASWQELGPFTPTVPAIATYTGRESMNSGRVTALAVAPTCVPGNCRLLVGAAGGGVWRTNNALAASPAWQSASTGLDTNSIGSLMLDPTNPNVVYAGTGEPNGSGDSEAGLGLYKSTDGGSTWALVAGSVAVSKDRSIGAIAIDPTNPLHIYIGTDVARHGSSSANGGRRTPPGAPTLGVYESTNGGASFGLVFSRPPNPTAPATGNDWFQGGVNDIELDPQDPGTVYAALFGYGVWRRSASLDGDSAFHQVFQTMYPADTFGDRTEIAPTVKNGKTRFYLADSSDDLGRADLWRADDTRVAAATLLASQSAAGGWENLSSPVNGTPGFGSYNFCGGQCGYDMPIATPPGRPDSIWIGGQMQYDEIFGGDPIPHRSNGRTIQRSVDAGVSFTDMTNDAREPAEGMHPDQHAIVFASSNPDIAFLGSDGGVVRTSGTFTDDSGECGRRGLRKADLVDCQNWLSAVPTVTHNLNDGLRTIQFQSLSLNAANPTADALGGTQDNGTWAYDGSSWFETVGGDGGQSGTDVGNANVRMHTYFDAQVDVNFSGTDPEGWDWIGDPLFASQELRSFYMPLINDPKVGGTWFVGMEHVWRTQDSGGEPAFLDANCNEYTGTFQAQCGDWVPLGNGQKGNLTGTAYGFSRLGHYVVATERAPSDSTTLWAGTRIGRLFISKNANNPNASQVTFTRVDDGESVSPISPGRFVSSIHVDPADSNHAWVSNSGYGAYTPNQPGHVFEVTFNPATGRSTYKDLSYNIGDQPVTDLVRDDQTGDLYAATDFGVLRLASGSTSWTEAASGLPPAAVYGLTISSASRVLYAATHGRGAFRLALP